MTCVFKNSGRASCMMSVLRPVDGATMSNYFTPFVSLTCTTIVLPVFGGALGTNFPIDRTRAHLHPGGIYSIANKRRGVTLPNPPMCRMEVLSHPRGYEVGVLSFALNQGVRTLSFPPNRRVKVSSTLPSVICTQFRPSQPCTNS